MSFKAVRGMKDILPEEMESWNYLERAASRIFKKYHYLEMRTPIVEETELFVRGVGESSDIVSKQMYTFQDRKGRSLTLRPEGTASVIRAYLEHGLHRQSSLLKLFYIGPFFRSERPQAGRARQFHQIGAEAIGSGDPALDVEIITLAVDLLKAFNLDGLEVNLNSLGCSECQQPYREVLVAYLNDKAKHLCSDCQYRIGKNPLRVLDCKRKECRPVIEKSPSIKKYLCDDCAQHFNSVQAYLDELCIIYRLDPYLVRGLDYYTRTAFEITGSHLGAQNTLAAGGRYDRLVEEMGGPSIPAVGFALGMERVIMAGSRKNKEKSPDNCLDVYLASQGKAAFLRAMGLLRSFRENNIDSDMDYENRSLKSQLRAANRLQARYVIIVPDEGEIILKDMQNSQQEEMDYKQVIDKIKSGLRLKEY